MNNADYHHFRMFGLDCIAPWPMPMCQPLSQIPTHPIRFEFGAAPAQLDGNPKSGYQKPWKQVRNGQLLLSLTDFSARIWVAGPHRVVLDCPADERALKQLRPFLLSTIAAALISLHGQLSLHVGGLLIDNQLILVTGHSGDGKSTLTAAALASGWRYVSDDMVAREAGANGRIYPGIPTLKLSATSREILLTSGLGQLDTPPLCWPKHTRTICDQEKVWLDGSDHFSHTSMQPSALVVLDNHGTGKPMLERLFGGDALSAAWQCSFRRKLCRNLMGREQHRERLLEFAAAQPMYKLRRCRSASGLTEELALLRKSLL